MSIVIVPLPVVSFSTYLTSTDEVAWRADDYNARDFILGIKERDVSGYAFVRCSGTWRRFENGNRQDVMPWLGEMVAEHFERHPMKYPFMLVPVPGSKVHVGFSGVPRTTMLANAIAAALPSAPAVRDVLRWDSPIVSSRLVAGTRDVATLFNRLRLVDSVEEERIVLVDDVLVLGGHLRACAATLRAGGADVVLALCAGRADQIRAADPFAVRYERWTTSRRVGSGHRPPRGCSQWRTDLVSACPKRWLRRLP